MQYRIEGQQFEGTGRGGRHADGGINMTNNTFISGAGFTKSIFDDAPLNNQLIDALLGVNPSGPLKEFSDEYNSRDIELVLTKLDIDIQQGKYASDNRKEINAEIAGYFQRFRFRPEILGEKTWLETFATKLFLQDDVILNLNYDCFLEGLLDYVEVWNPNRGYGNITNPLVEDSHINPMNIQILKIHGSEHFSSQPFQDKPESYFITYEFNESIFPRSAKNTFYGRRSITRAASDPSDVAKPYIIAPSYVKIPPIEISYLMLDAIEAVKNSKNLIIIGCGMRSEDSYLWLLLTRFLVNDNWRERKIIIVDPQAARISQKIKQHWAVNLDNSIAEIPHKLETGIDELLGSLN
jgi:hypothetical protein